MDKVRVCVDAVGGDEKPEVVLAGIEAALEADADLDVLVAGPRRLLRGSALCMIERRLSSRRRSSPWRMTPYRQS